MHLHFEKNNNAKCDCNILSLSWMGKVPDELPEDEGWKLNRTNYYQEGWLATGNARGLVGVTFTTSHCRTRAAELPLRANYNLRGHRSEVILVKWNEPYQKLASCDSSGVIFVWIKYEGRWSIELINDRSTPVTHFSWSHDGRMALICYQDGFVLVGSVAGQRYWSSMLNDQATITCGIWTPDDQQVYFGTTAGQLIVMDVHGAMVSEVQLAAAVTSMAWSAEKFKMEEGDDDVSGNQCQQDERVYVLAVCLADGNIVLLRSFDDVSPVTIKTGLKSPLLAEWSNSRKLLAVAGIRNGNSESHDQLSQQEYANSLQFYADAGTLVYATVIPYAQCPVSALTWGHNDRRLFVATGARVHAAWVSRRVGSLQLLSRLAVRAALSRESSVSQLPLPPRLRALVAALFASTIRCCVPEPRELRKFVSRPPVSGGRLHCTMLRHAGEPAPCYTLYLEYLGGLVPLLKGRRTSKIRPEFVIFDPQSQDSTNSLDYPRTTPYQSYNSDGSDTERDTAELCGSPRHRRKNRRKRGEERSTEENDDLAYVDTLPEHARLVEVTSNIWGTKFKIHGLTDSVPANLGQVTYRTSLLHLQPRQMTLVITELRDDVPAGPDPSFNPNLFSEDEEEVFPEPRQGTTRLTSEAQLPPIAPMTPRNSRLNANRPKSQISNQFVPSDVLSPVLARAESYEDEFPYVDLQDVVNYCENLRTTGTGNAYRTPSPRHHHHHHHHSHNHNHVHNHNHHHHHHHTGPRCCDVPTLQSPKNAVAPTQTLIATSSPTTDYATTMQRVKTALADQQTNVAHNKKDTENNNKINQIQTEEKLIVVPLSTQTMSVGGGVQNNSTSSSCTSNAMFVLGVNGHSNPVNASQSQQAILFNGQASVHANSSVENNSNSLVSKSNVNVNLDPTSYNGGTLVKSTNRASSPNRESQVQQQSSTSSHGNATLSTTTTTTIHSNQPVAVYQSTGARTNGCCRANGSPLPPSSNPILTTSSSSSPTSSSSSSSSYSLTCSATTSSVVVAKSHYETIERSPPTNVHHHHHRHHHHHHHHHHDSPHQHQVAATTTSPSSHVIVTQAQNQSVVASPVISTNQQPQQQQQRTKEGKTQGCCGKSIPSGNQVGIAPGKSYPEELRYIDEDNCPETSASLIGSRTRVGVRRTPTVLGIGPSCLADPIVRSCSVGYLDLVDSQMVPCEVALRMLRKEAPNKRLVLVSRKTRKKRKNKTNCQTEENGQPSAKPPRLKNCGKSRSLDSSDIFPNNEPRDIITVPQLPEHLEEVTIGIETSELEDSARDTIENELAINLDLTKRKTPPVSPQLDPEEPFGKSCPPKDISSSEVCPCYSPARESSPSNSVASSLDGLAARLRDFDEIHSLPPPSPRPTSRLPRSSPSSPAPSKKGKRPASASPIRRRLLSSPLLGRKSRKSRGESSDDEALVQDESSRNYRDLETFQKAQLRQKLKQRGQGLSSRKGAEVIARRELIMHNKAPMWNESSQVYQLDFGGRVTQESAKNFQIEFRGKQVMQFGRIDGNAYTLDFQYPFSALQAFAVALANVTQRLK